MKKYLMFLLLGVLLLTLSACTPLGYCEEDGMYYWLDDDGIRQSAAMDDPDGPRWCPAVAPEPKKSMPVVVPMMWMLTNDDDGWWCVLISDTHPSVIRQNQACFPDLNPTWQATHGNSCNAPVYNDGSDYGHWPCDKRLEAWRILTNGSAAGDGRIGLKALRKVNERHLDKLEEAGN